MGDQIPGVAGLGYAMRKLLRGLDRFELFILGASLLGGVLFLFLPQNSVLSWFTTDDAFYYFVTAKNISLGLGSTFDGIALTNGYHPLWLLICVPIFALSRVNLYLPLRLIILLQYALTAISSILLYKLTRSYISQKAACIIAFLWLFLPAIQSTLMVGGVESTVNGLLILAVLYGIDKLRKTALSSPDLNLRYAVLGTLAGLTILARLDNVFLIGFIGIWVGINLLREHFNDQVTKKFSLVDIQPLIWFGLPIIILVGAYLSWNQIHFGSIIPVSGAVKHWWGEISGDPYGNPPDSLRQLYLETFASTNRNIVPFWLPYKFGQSIAQPLNHFLASMGLPPVVKTLWIVIALGLVALLEIPSLIRAIDRLSLLPLLLGSAFQVGYYKIGGSVATRSWYWVQEVLLFLLLAGVVLGIVLRLLERHHIGKYLANITTAIILIVVGIAQMRYFWRNFVDVDRGLHEYLATARFLQDETEPGSIIGIVASGSAAYFTQGRTIVNLDGLINGFEYLRALQHDQAAEYLRSINVQYVMGSEVLLLENPPYASNFVGQLSPLQDAPSAGRENTLWKLHGEPGDE
ncbi:MAG: hypothetical protein P8X64_17230 [Anaerolineales bacterium]